MDPALARDLGLDTGDAEFPSPLWGGVRGGGREVIGVPVRIRRGQSNRVADHVDNAFQILEHVYIPEPNDCEAPRFQF